MLYNQLLLKQRLQINGEGVTAQQEDMNYNNNNNLPGSTNNSDNVGRKLEGPATLTLKFPQRLRYILSQIAPQAAVIKQWENSILRGPGGNHMGGTRVGSDGSMFNSRMFCSRARAYPTGSHSLSLSLFFLLSLLTARSIY